MSAISITRLYDMLSAKMGKETVEHLTTYIDNKTTQDLEKKCETLATKEDLSRLELKITEKFNEQISLLKDLMGDTKVQFFRWIFAFWITVILLFIGLYFKG
jgi:hypothetical protein